MSTFFETGHGKNAANFEDLISFSTGYGTTYNPSQAAIKVTALQTIHASAIAALTLTSSKNTTYKNATNAREIAFEPLKRLATRIANAFISCGAKKQSIDDVQHFVRKIRGKAKRFKAGAELAKAISTTDPPAADAPTTPPVTALSHSISQQSFDSIIEHIASLLDLLGAETLYNPNEADLKVSALTTLLTDLKAKNTSVINAYTALSNARIARDKVLYTEGTGLVDIALEVKAYIKSVFGGTSPQYKQVSRLTFKNIKS